mmetsp:Transcript_88250/g.273452  ORF Transcript_88250/g.273452 Transcript_88250/m.273452 type:complete len:301 (-) Transcript_88250:168-1070(-)
MVREGRGREPWVSRRAASARRGRTRRAPARAARSRPHGTHRTVAVHTIHAARQRELWGRSGAGLAPIMRRPSSLQMRRRAPTGSRCAQTRPPRATPTLSILKTSASRPRHCRRAKIPRRHRPSRQGPVRAECRSVRATLEPPPWRRCTWFLRGLPRYRSACPPCRPSAEPQTTEVSALCPPAQPTQRGQLQLPRARGPAPPLQGLLAPCRAAWTRPTCGRGPRCLGPDHRICRGRAASPPLRGGRPPRPSAALPWGEAPARPTPSGGPRLRCAPGPCRHGGCCAAAPRRPAPSGRPGRRT